MWGFSDKNEFFLLPRVDSSRCCHWSVIADASDHVNDRFCCSYRLNSHMCDDDDNVVVGRTPDFPTGVIVGYKYCHDSGDSFVSS